MITSYSLIKENPLLPAEDYVALRNEGFKSIEKLSSDIWTDYNNSDPGITMLEAICYAITDLAYRTGFDVKDLLTPEQLNEDTWKNIFYTAKQIFYNNPLTINDYRKLIIDVTGVRNAWVQPSKDYEVPVWVDYNYEERRKDADCGCANKEMKTCYGKLSLQPNSKIQADERNKKRTTEIINAQAEITKKLLNIDGSITKIQENISANPDDEVENQNLQIKLNALMQEKSKLTAEQNELNTEQAVINAMVYFPSKILEMEGLYNVMVEYEEDVIDEGHREEIRQQVVDRLVAHRNLCEDFLSINAVEYFDFGIGASIVLEEYADPDEVLAEMFFVIYNYFTPSLGFYTIQQMMEKGYQADEIFEGPALQHGFIDTNELEKTDFYRDIRLSDIISLVSDISGVKAITYLHFPFLGFNNEKDKFYFNQWVKMLSDQRKIARIIPAMSSALFCKEHDFISFFTGRPQDRKPDRMLKKFSDKKKKERTYKLKGQDDDFAVPAGEYMQLQDYFPITESLPLCYGVNSRGLPGDADAKRIAQSLQLKGYLLFFEQLLADYLVQLDHLRDLFSFSNEKQTYFTRALTAITDLKSLLIDQNNHGDDHFEEILKDFAQVLQSIAEPHAEFIKRRNQFLNHLLARFSENMDEYESIMQWMENGNAGHRLIGDKERILQDGNYYKISTNRGQAYNYTSQEFWDTENVSGAEARICRLLGFKNICRSSLAPDFISSQAVMVEDEKTKVQSQKKNAKGQYLNNIVIVSPDNKKQVLFTSVEVADGCCTEELMGDILAHADNPVYFKFHEALKQRSRKSAGVVGDFWFELWDDTNPETAVLLGSSEKFDQALDRDTAFTALQKTMQAVNENEGLHLVEHILLRPRIYEEQDEAGNIIPVSFPDICLNICDLGKGLDEGTEIPDYQKRIHRVPPDKCYDNMPWVLEYYKLNASKDNYDQSILFQQSFDNGKDPVPLKFRFYEQMAQRVKDLQEFGSERINYSILPNNNNQSANGKYCFIIKDAKGNVLAQSLYAYNQKTGSAAVVDDIEAVIERLMLYFGYQLDLYCEANPCDNNEDPYSFRTTIVLPCWPKRLRDKTFQHFVEKTIEAETPAHIHSKQVWLGIEQMKKFEQVYFAWLTEMAQTEIPGYGIVNPLIETIKTQQPCGSCADDC